MKKLIALLTLVFCFNCYSQFAPPRGGGKTKENKPTGTRELRPNGGVIPTNRIPLGGVPMALPSGKVGIPKANSKPITSFTGLEGWGKKEGVSITVEDYSNRDKTFDAKAIKNQVELKLRLAGIKVAEKLSFDRIVIDIQPVISGERLVGYSLKIKAIRNMTFKYNGKEYIALGSGNWSSAGHTPPNYRKGLEEDLDRLLLDYLKANPKK